MSNTYRYKKKLFEHNSNSKESELISSHFKDKFDESLEERLGITRRGFLKSVATVGAGAIIASAGIDLLLNKEAQANDDDDLHIYCGNPAVFTMYLILAIHDFKLPKKYMIILNRWSDPGRAPGTPLSIKNIEGNYVIENKWSDPGRAPGTPLSIKNIEGNYVIENRWSDPGRAPGTPILIKTIEGNYVIENRWSDPGRAPGTPLSIKNIEGNYVIENRWSDPGRAPGTPLSIKNIEGNYVIENRWSDPGRAPATPILIKNIEGNYYIKNKWSDPGRAPGTPYKIIFTDSKEEVVKHYPHLKDSLNQ